jgi:hypothetical protein
MPCPTDARTATLLSKRAVLAQFFEQLGPERCQLIESASVDLRGSWPAVIARYCPDAAICADPFHVVKLAGEALDELRRSDWQRLRETEPERARWLKGTRFLLRRRSETLGDRARSVLEDLAETNRDVYRGWLLTDQLRMVYLAETREEARDLIDEWIFAAATAPWAAFLRSAACQQRAERLHLARGQQRVPGGHELDRAPDEPPRPGLPSPSVAAVADHPRLRSDPGRATHVNARRGQYPLQDGSKSQGPAAVKKATNPQAEVHRLLRPRALSLIRPRPRRPSRRGAH